jgi:DDE superfamily endonuclease
LRSGHQAGEGSNARRRPPLSRNQKAVNRAHAKIRGIGERAIATLKCWKLLAKLHCCPQRATQLLAAILILQHIEEQRLGCRLAGFEQARVGIEV